MILRKCYFNNKIIFILCKSNLNPAHNNIFNDFIRRDFSKVLKKISVFQTEPYSQRRDNIKLEIKLLEGFSLIFFDELVDAKETFETTLEEFPYSYLPILGLIEIEILNNEITTAWENCKLILREVNDKETRDFAQDKLIKIEEIQNYLKIHRGISLILNG